MTNPMRWIVALLLGLASLMILPRAQAADDLLADTKGRMAIEAQRVEKEFTAGRLAAYKLVRNDNPQLVESTQKLQELLSLIRADTSLDDKRRQVLLVTLKADLDRVSDIAREKKRFTTTERATEISRTTRDNVELVDSGIARLTPRGIETVDGKHRDVDLIVFATGYDVIKYLSPADYRGQGGRSLREFWGDDARAYLGLLVPHFPNLFMLYGPNSQPVSGGISLPSWFQIWAAYVAQCLVAMFDGEHAAISVTGSAFEEYNKRLDAEASGMAFVTDKGSAAKNYYLNSSGRLQVNTPFETADLYAMQKVPDFDDLEFS